MKLFTVALAITSTLLVSPGWAEEAPFLLERKIPLGEVRGRIDHLAVDLKQSGPRSMRPQMEMRLPSSFLGPFSCLRC